VRVNAIAPGPILTDNLARGDAAARAAVAVPLRRVGLADEVAAAAVWLCSEPGAFVTGTTLTIDGGLVAGTQPFGRPAGAAPTPEAVR
jgi:NAD(P)-dependent dehydrogenase (short-subunit alcohol dehydrogenase family)